jgi:hypothetical protein
VTKRKRQTGEEEEEEEDILMPLIKQTMKVKVDISIVQQYLSLRVSSLK